MNKIVEIMAKDMSIPRYSGEVDEFYSYRILYSALGLWCLTSSLNKKNGIREISKKAQTILLHELLNEYLQLCPLAKRFLDGSRTADIAIHIRNLYEQMGFLLTLDDNHNVLNQGGETIKVSETCSLFLGVPESTYCINGLGIYSQRNEREIDLKEYLVRDNLSPEEYLLSCYNSCDFDEKDIEFSELEFFNPFYRGQISKAWQKYRNADMTIARKSPKGPFYRVMKNEEDNLIFASENNNDEINTKTGAEFRRIYVALREYYLNPMTVLVCPIDDQYTYIKILGQLPNREYYYMLLNSWPKNSFNDRNNFIIRKELTASAVKVLTDIGFVTKEGKFYG